MADQKSCETCRHWDVANASGGFAQCQVMSTLSLPFWCAGWTFEGNDHDDWTKPGDGRRCAAWQEKEPSPL